MIDELDQKLIVELEEDARASNIDISKKVFASERTVRNRLKNLLDNSIIRPTISLNLEKLGFRFMSIMALQVGLTSIREVGLELAKHPNICYATNITGRFDFLAIVITKSSKEYARLVEDFISKIPGVQRTETFTILSIYKGQETNLNISGLIRQIELSKSKDYEEID